MYNQLKNNKGELLYIITLNKIGEASPMVRIKTWEQALECLNAWTTVPSLNKIMHRQLIFKDIVDDKIHVRSAKAAMRETLDGQYADVFSYITIEPAYTD